MARTRPSNRTPKPKATGRTSANNIVPDIYRDMLADAISPSTTDYSDEGRAVKRRRVGGRIITQGNEEPVPQQLDQSGSFAHDSDMDELFEDVKPNLQHIIQTESEDSANSDVDWEEVELRQDIVAHDIGEDEPEALDIILGGGTSQELSSSPAITKRKPITAEEKKLRLDIHKLYLCSLMAHVFLRNHWCNDVKVYSVLKSLLTKKMVSYLNPDKNQSQFQRSRSFMDGLTQASEAFKGKFKITARGMAKPMWGDSPQTLAEMQPPEDVDLPMQLSDFRDAAARLKSSRDVGAQLFCALLRSAGVDARLVCSLQLLPFQPAQKATLSQVKRHASKAPNRASPQITTDPESDSDTKSDELGSARQIIGSSGGRSRFEPSNQENAERLRRSASPADVPLRSKKHLRKPIRESKYPIYWVEAFNEAVQKWVPVDPLVTRTIAKPSMFEPPAGEPENHMSYVFAFEDDGSARDVTRRYTKAYNAKTRRDRVEVTNGGERWLRRVRKMYRRSHALDRDQVEDAELAAKEAAEPMPRNVQDFRDHPYYALERHLRRHEVIHPKRQVGKLGAGRAGSTDTLEAIYRRRDVHLVKSADKWYRLGREIKPGEQPLKLVPARRARDQIRDLADPETALEESAGTALYAAYQTTLYSAPPVQNGRIPKNMYGNLDIYVPSMVPPGGTHNLHPETARAARMLGIDYADAVTGFIFKGRHGTAVTNGAVVASEYKEAIEEVLKAFDDERSRVEEEKRSAAALRMWRRFLAGLIIRERIEGYEVEGERDAVLNEEMEEAESDGEDAGYEGGGFLPDRDEGETSQLNAERRFAPRGLADLAEAEGGGFDVEAPEEGSLGQDKSSMAWEARDPFPNNTEDDGGGFLIDDSDAEEGLRDAGVNDLETSIPGSANDPDPGTAAPQAASETDKISTLDNPAPHRNPQKSSNQALKTSHKTISHSHTPPPNPQALKSSDPQLPTISATDLEEATTLQQLQ